MLSKTKPNHTKPNQTIPYQAMMKLSQRLQMDVVSNKTYPYQSKPTLNLHLNSQNKSDLDETFTEASDGCCLKPNLTIPSQTKPYQTITKSSLKQPKQVGF